MRYSSAALARSAANICYRFADLKGQGGDVAKACSARPLPPTHGVRPSGVGSMGQVRAAWDRCGQHGAGASSMDQVRAAWG
eukprot:165806-Chlamydomonas_euryale.AAC.6